MTKTELNKKSKASLKRMAASRKIKTTLASGKDKTKAQLVSALNKVIKPKSKKATKKTTKKGKSSWGMYYAVKSIPSENIYQILYNDPKEKTLRIVTYYDSEGSSEFAKRLKKKGYKKFKHRELKLYKK